MYQSAQFASSRTRVRCVTPDASTVSARIFTKYVVTLPRMIAMPMPTTKPIRIRPSISNVDKIAFEPFYRVLLKYTDWVDGKETATRVKRAIDAVSLGEAFRAVRHAEKHGVGIVITAEEAKAKTYVRRLEKQGLSALIEEA